MRRIRLLGGLVLTLLAAPVAMMQPQGKGQGKEHGKDHGAQAKGKVQGKQTPDVARGRSVEKGAKPQQSAARGRSELAKVDKPSRSANAVASRGAPASRRVEIVGGEVTRSEFRKLVGSPKRGQRLAARAVERATKHGSSDDDFVIAPAANRIRILNRSGALLLDLDDDRDIGVWKVVTEPDREKSGSPSFCRSGAGHPVWGRQWCIDKGFGLGRDGDIRWTRVVDPGSIMIRRPVTTGILARDVLLGVLGDVVFNRLAAQAITLGYVEPLSGRWIGEPSSGRRVLLLTSADRPVAEFVDFNRDNRVDLLVVAARP